MSVVSKDLVSFNDVRNGEHYLLFILEERGNGKMPYKLVSLADPQAVKDYVKNNPVMTHQLKLFKAVPVRVKQEIVVSLDDSQIEAAAV